MVMHFFGSEEPGVQPLSTEDILQLFLMGVWLLGLIAAWKWELAGAIAALAAYTVHIYVNWAVLSFPILLIPITALLFLGSWWLNRPTKEESTPV